jgi:hypothetical protein
MILNFPIYVFRASGIATLARHSNAALARSPDIGMPGYNGFCEKFQRLEILLPRISNVWKEEVFLVAGGFHSALLHRVDTSGEKKVFSIRYIFWRIVEAERYAM